MQRKMKEMEMELELHKSGEKVQDEGVSGSGTSSTLQLEDVKKFQKEKK
jgi:hypothetical protein